MSIAKKIKHRIEKTKDVFSRWQHGEKEFKVFCIGLHKTGTTSLHKFAREHGFRSVHSSNWFNEPATLANNNFFSDGGSHFDGQNEFPIADFYENYPNAKFILQTRDIKEWVQSKCKHAGWKSDTTIQPDDASKLMHNEWRYKSLLTVRKFIEHKINYEKKVRDFFRDKDNLIEIDVTDNSKREANLNKLFSFLEIEKPSSKAFPHVNKASNSVNLPKELLKLIHELC